MLHLSLPHSRLVIGEIFPLPELQALLHAPFDRQSDHVARAEQTIPRTVLLYPAADRASAVSAPALVEQSLREVPPHLRLVVLDATWRKSRKMLYLNPLLQQLPRLTLRDPPPSQYLIRQSHRPHQRSTLEATCFALMQLERSDEKYLPLLTAFQGFVAQQAGYMPVRRDSQSN